jgi:hypothetical protein
MPANDENRAIEDLRSYARSLVDAVPSARGEAVIGRALAARRRHRRSRRLVVALATAGLLAVSSVGLAAVSDAAAPGDFLYPVDRGYEWAGDLFGARNRTHERLAESQVLNQRGHIDQAIEFLESELVVESHDHDLIITAIAELETKVSQNRQNEGRSNPPEVVSSTPAVTAPGQVDDPVQAADPDAVEVPGPVEPPGLVANPGKVKDDKVRPKPESPSVTAPGQTKDREAEDPPSAEPDGKGDAGSNGRRDEAPGHNKDTPVETTVTVRGGTDRGYNRP